MKSLFFFGLLFFYHAACAQYLRNDSLDGFDVGAAMVQARERYLNQEETKQFVQQEARAFISSKYQLKKEAHQAAEASASKYSPATTNAWPCIQEDFESLQPGPIGSAGWWGPPVAGNGVTYLCNSGTVALPSAPNSVVIYTTPLSDAHWGTLPSSPLGGQVAKVNDGGLKTTRMRQQHGVSAASYLYCYAYAGALSEGLHGCCQDAYLMFRFYTNTNAPIPALNHTVVLGTQSCMPTSTVNWAPSTASVSMYYTPKWQGFIANLAPYIGSTVWVEVIASGCLYNQHHGYAYYDALCCGSAVLVNKSDVVSCYSGLSYTSCVPTATVEVPGFTSYQWLGPSGSGISGATSSVITTSVSGNYTLTALSGSVNLSTVINLVVNPTIPSIAGNSIHCTSTTSTLQVAGAGLGSATYSWSNGSTSPSIGVSPSASTSYSVVITNSLGCVSSASMNLTVYPSPSVSISSTLITCPGSTIQLTASAAGITSFTWNTGAVSPSIAAAPLSNTVFVASATNSSGCVGSASRAITVLQGPLLQLSQSSSSLCAGQTLILTASGHASNTYSWSTGATSASLYPVPRQNSTYTVTATSISGCTASASATVLVQPVPQVQVISSGTQICEGESTSLGIVGSNIFSVLWSTGASNPSISISPTMSTAYSATVTSLQGCAVTPSASVIVHALPQIQIVASSATICAGESATLSVNGIGSFSYLWQNNQTTGSIVVSPAASSFYSVVVTDANGCIADNSFQLSVAACTDTLFSGVKEHGMGLKGLSIFPNPSAGTFEVKGSTSGAYLLLNALGQKLKAFELLPENHFRAVFAELPSGVYFVTDGQRSEKVIVK